MWHYIWQRLKDDRKCSESFIHLRQRGPVIQRSSTAFDIICVSCLYVHLQGLPLFLFFKSRNKGLGFSTHLLKNLNAACCLPVVNGGIESYSWLEEGGSLVWVPLSSSSIIISITIIEREARGGIGGGSFMQTEEGFFFFFFSKFRIERTLLLCTYKNLSSKTSIPQMQRKKS